MNGASVHSAVTMGNRADSFYEYLLKGWLLTGKKDEVVEWTQCDVETTSNVSRCHSWNVLVTVN